MALEWPPMARSELLIALALVSGCDVVVGLSGDQRPCGNARFGRQGHADRARPMTSRSTGTQTFAVLASDGAAVEYRFSDKSQTRDRSRRLQHHRARARARGQRPVLHGLDRAADLDGGRARRKSAWRTGQRVPQGTYAGTPSADTFGPRRSLVRARPRLRDGPGVRGSGRRVGRGRRSARRAGLRRAEPHAERPDDGLPRRRRDSPGIFLATRASTDAWFGTPVLVLEGEHRFPQLLGRCSDLYVIDDGTLTRYER